MKKAIPSFLLLVLFHSPSLAQFDFIGSGRAIQFDGINDYVDMGDIYDDLTFPLSISAWVYAQPSSRYMLPVFASQDNAPLYNGFWFCLTSTNLFFEYGDGRGDQNSAYRRGKSAVVSNLQGRWIHVAAVVKGPSDIQLYVNGHDVGGGYTGSSTLPMASDYPGDVAKAGYFYTNSAVHRFYGFMDELRVWSRAISQSEIREMMCHRLNGNESGLIGYWNFDETNGDVAYDLSINKFNGALVGNPSRVYSGAPVGDESRFLYTSNWSDAQLAHGDLLVSEVSGNVYGVHTYVVNSLPSQSGGLAASTAEPPYYGVFLADDGGTNTFDFSFQEGLVCAVYKRLDNSIPDWSPSESMTAIRTRLEVIPTFEASELHIDLGADSVSFCDETFHTLEADTETAGLAYLWSTGETTPAITVSTSGTFSLRVTSGCQVAYDSIKVSFLSPPPAFSLGQDVTTCKLEPRLLVTDLHGDYDFTWQDGSKEPSLQVNTFGTYWLSVENVCGVSADTVAFTQNVPGDISVFNFISPDNQDGLNQYFVVDELLAGSHLAIFNRWGKMLFESFNYENNWDGDGLPAGVYYYTIEGECFEPMKGTITINR